MGLPLIFDMRKFISEFSLNISELFKILFLDFMIKLLKSFNLLSI